MKEVLMSISDMNQANIMIDQRSRTDFKRMIETEGVGHFASGGVFVS